MLSKYVLFQKALQSVTFFLFMNCFVIFSFLIFAGTFYNKSCVAETLNSTNYVDFRNGWSMTFEKFKAEYIEKFPNSTVQIDTLAWYEVKEYRGFDDCKWQYTTPSEEYFE